MTKPVTTDQLEELRAEFAGRWRIWRSQRDGVPASWCASIRDPSAGVDSLVMEGTADKLRAALIDQRQRREGGEPTYYRM
jgi:hypothetical protein